MISYIPPEITIASFSLVGVLTGYVWNDQNKRICKVEEEHQKCPYNRVAQDVAQMKNDIDWIKKYLIKN